MSRNLVLSQDRNTVYSSFGNLRPPIDIEDIEEKWNQDGLALTVTTELPLTQLVDSKKISRTFLISLLDKDSHYSPEGKVIPKEVMKTLVEEGWEDGNLDSFCDFFRHQNHWYSGYGWRCMSKTKKGKAKGQGPGMDGNTSGNDGGKQGGHP